MFRWILTLVCIISSNLAYSDSLRCGTRLVSPGDSKAQVLLRCGEPLIKTTSKVLSNEKMRKFISKSTINGNGPKLTHQQTNETVVVTRWAYNPGKGKFLRLLTFYGDELKFISLGERVE